MFGCVQCLPADIAATALKTAADHISFIPQQARQGLSHKLLMAICNRKRFSICTNVIKYVTIAHAKTYLHHVLTSLMICAKPESHKMRQNILISQLDDHVRNTSEHAQMIDDKLGHKSQHV